MRQLQKGHQRFSDADVGKGCLSCVLSKNKEPKDLSAKRWWQVIFVGMEEWMLRVR